MPSPTTKHVTRVGAANLKMDAVGGDFSSPADLGTTHPDGVTFTLEGEELEVMSGVTLGPADIFNVAKRLTVETMILEHSVAALARALGQDASDVVDTAGSPSQEQVAFKTTFRGWAYYALEIKVPQPDDLTLFDHYRIYRAALLPKFEQSITVKGDRYLGVQFKATQDPANSNEFGYGRSEY